MNETEHMASLRARNDAARDAEGTPYTTATPVAEDGECASKGTEQPPRGARRWGSRFTLTTDNCDGETVEIQDGDVHHRGRIWLCVGDSDGDAAAVYLAPDEWDALDKAARKFFARMKREG